MNNSKSISLVVKMKLCCVHVTRIQSRVSETINNPYS